MLCFQKFYQKIFQKKVIECLLIQLEAKSLYQQLRICFILLKHGEQIFANNAICSGNSKTSFYIVN